MGIVIFRKRGNECHNASYLCDLKVWVNAKKGPPDS
jgi:hypothetical protein